jgi:hypothetical protein
MPPTVGIYLQLLKKYEKTTPLIVLNQFVFWTDHIDGLPIGLTIEVVLISTKVDMFLDMIIGMILGMVASPLMMKAIKSIKQRRKVSRMLREISELQKNGELSYGDQVL